MSNTDEGALSLKYENLSIPIYFEPGPFLRAVSVVNILLKKKTQSTAQIYLNGTRIWLSIHFMTRAVNVLFLKLSFRWQSNAILRNILVR